jgi:hypothetical protein
MPADRTRSDELCQEEVEGCFTASQYFDDVDEIITRVNEVIVAVGKVKRRNRHDTPSAD